MPKKKDPKSLARDLRLKFLIPPEVIQQLSKRVPTFEEKSCIKEVLKVPSRSGLIFPQRHQERLSEAAQLYFAIKEQVDPYRSSDIRQQLTKLAIACAHFEKAVDNLCIMARNALRIDEEGLKNTYDSVNLVYQSVCMGHPVLYDETGKPVQDEETLEWIQDYNATPGSALVIDDKGGRPLSESEVYFLKELMFIYESATGKRASVTHRPVEKRYCGRFFNFAWNCFVALGNTQHSNGAFGEKIRRLRKSLKSGSAKI